MHHPNKQFGVVRWNDAHGESSAAAEKDFKHAPAIFQTYGWFVISDSEGISIASDWDTEDNEWRDRSFIPRAMVIEEVVLELSKKRTRKQKSATPAE